MQLTKLNNIKCLKEHLCKHFGIFQLGYYSNGGIYHIDTGELIQIDDSNSDTIIVIKWSSTFVNKYDKCNIDYDFSISILELGDNCGCGVSNIYHIIAKDRSVKTNYDSMAIITKYFKKKKDEDKLISLKNVRIFEHEMTISVCCNTTC